MENQEKIKSIIKDLMEQLYEAKGFDDLRCNPLERNIFEAEMKALWEDIEPHIMLHTDEREEYEEEIENLREENQILQNDKVDLIDRNYNLNEENNKLREILSIVSQAVNGPWY